jgi:abortive infection bacteriophage resistance protein
MLATMLPPYAKPHLTFADQVQLLKGRGLAITSEWHAERHLARIGYYRLKDYWHPLRQSRPVIRPDGSRYIDILEDFRSGTSFEHAVALYIFDKRLRLLMSDAIERIEVALRVDVAHTLGKRNAFAHRETGHLDPKRSISARGHSTRHSLWLTRADEAERRSKADWLKEFRLKYRPPLPIWMAVETWEFGSLSHLIEMAHPSDRFQISQKYGIADPELLTSWIKVLSYVRNVCAHHGRLWNHPLINQPKLPKGNDAPMVAHIATYLPSQSRIYAAAAVTQHFLGIINPSSSWKERLKNLWNDFPSIPAVHPAHAGFMPTWSNQALWQ